MTDPQTRLRAANPAYDPDLPPTFDRVWERIERDQLLGRGLACEDGVHQRQRPLARRAAVVVAALVAAGAAAVAVVFGLAGNGVPSAFAGWSANPTRAGRAQLQRAESACTALVSLPASLVPTLVDTRGPTSLLLYLDPGASPSMATLCISGVPDFGTRVRFDTVEGATAATPGSIDERSTGISATADHNSFGFIDGVTGSQVTAVTLVLTDGRHIRATTSHGWFAAWWPKYAFAQAARITTTTGTSSARFQVPDGRPTAASPACCKLSTGPSSTAVP
jgi:hypothetical protein